MATEEPLRDLLAAYGTAEAFLGTLGDLREHVAVVSAPGSVVPPRSRAHMIAFLARWEDRQDFPKLEGDIIPFCRALMRKHPVRLGRFSAASATKLIVTIAFEAKTILTRHLAPVTRALWAI